MADKDEISEEGEEGEEEKKPTGKLKLILILVAIVVLLGGAGGGAYWYFVMAEEDVTEGVEGTEAIEEEFDEDRAVAIYHKIRPAFRTTFSANNRQRYMQVEVTLVTRQEEVVSALVTHQPLIVNALVMLFADADYLELQTSEGKETLRLAASTAVDEILEKEAMVSGIEKVLFTQFVMQ